MVALVRRGVKQAGWLTSWKGTGAAACVGPVGRWNACARAMCALACLAPGLREGVTQREKVWRDRRGS